MRARVLKRVSLLAPVGVVLVLTFHLGPALGFNTGPRVVQTATLRDGSQLYLIQTRNKSLLDAYSSVLFRVYPDRRREATGLGTEDSYWWFASLRPTSDGKSVEIRYCGTLEATYDVRLNQTQLVGSKEPLNPQTLPPGFTLGPIN
jgi:hypothetical protein